jgi:hypothetical protein
VIWNFTKLRRANPKRVIPPLSRTLKHNQNQKTPFLPTSTFTVASTKSKLNFGKRECSFVKYRYTEIREHPQFVENAAFPVGQAKFVI